MSLFAKTKLFTLYLFLGSALILTGCGGGGGGGSTAPAYTGVTTPAAIDTNNAETIGVTATESLTQAVSTGEGNDSNPFAVSISSTSGNLSQFITDIAEKVASATTPNLPAGVTLTSDELNSQSGQTLFCGGSVSIPDNFGNGGTQNGTMTFNSLCFNDGSTGNVVISGSVTFTQTSTSITISYVNFTVTFNGQTETVNATITCDTSFASCSFSSDYVGSDGTTYRVDNFTVSGTPAAGYQIEGTFYHPTHGKVTFTTAPTVVTFGCTNGNPDSGTVTLTSDDGSSMTVTFRADCTGYDGTWDDGAGGTGMFSGNWPA